jgi:NADH-quinone oxidoreductase subunit J
VLVGALGFLIFSGNTQTVVLQDQSLSLSHAVAKTGNVEAFGNALFHGFLFPFEVTSLLIVIAILGALVFGRRA